MTERDFLDDLSDVDDKPPIKKRYGLVVGERCKTSAEFDATTPNKLSEIADVIFEDENGNVEP